MKINEVETVTKKIIITLDESEAKELHDIIGFTTDGNVITTKQRVVAEKLLNAIDFILN